MNGDWTLATEYPGRDGLDGGGDACDDAGACGDADARGDDDARDDDDARGDDAAHDDDAARRRLSCGFGRFFAGAGAGLGAGGSVREAIGRGKRGGAAAGATGAAGGAMTRGGFVSSRDASASS